MTDTPIIDYSDQAEAAVGYRAGLAASELKPVPLNLANDVAALVPEGFKVKTFGGEAYAARPNAVRGTAKLHTVDAFVEYVARHQDDRTTVWVDVPKRRLEAVLDDHVGGEQKVVSTPSWGEHRADLQLVHSPEWKRWTEKDGHQFTQPAFATFIEDYVDDVTEPAAATMLELARTFHAKKDSTYASAIHTQSGTVELEHVEKVKAGAGQQSAPIEVPEFLTLALSVFDGGPRFAVRARFMYRINEGKLALSFRLLKLDDTVRHAFENTDETDPGILTVLHSHFDRVYLGNAIGADARRHPNL